MSIKQWPVKKVKLSEMNPAPYNPRVMNEAERAALRASLERWGLADLITWNKTTGNIVGGHQRYDQLVEDGIASAQVVVVELSEAEEKALNVQLNNPRAQGRFTDSVDVLIASIKKDIPDLPTELRLEEITVPNIGDVDVGGLGGVDDDGAGAISSNEEAYKVLVVCDDERSQIELLERLESEGFTCRALIS